jgi:hypothetical protein
MHFLENFFGIVRWGSLGGDRLVPTVRIRTIATVVYEVLHEFGLEIKYSGRENISGTIINDQNIEFTEGGADVYFRSFIHVAHLEIDDPEDDSILPSVDRMKEVFVMQSTEDDPICHTNVPPVANCRITTRNIGP